MAIHIFSPASPAQQRARAAKRTLDHIRIHPTNRGFLVEHHFADTGGPMGGQPERYTHPTLADVQDHLTDHLGGLDLETSADEGGGPPTRRGA